MALLITQQAVILPLKRSEGEESPDSVSGPRELPGNMTEMRGFFGYASE